jgi:hypothetical protein
LLAPISRETRRRVNVRFQEFRCGPYCYPDAPWPTEHTETRTACLRRKGEGPTGLEPATFGATIPYTLLPGVAHRFITRLDMRISLLTVAHRCGALRPQWCQRGVKRCRLLPCPEAPYGADDLVGRGELV